MMPAGMSARPSTADLAHALCAELEPFFLSPAVDRAAEREALEAAALAPAAPFEALAGRGLLPAAWLPCLPFELEAEGSLGRALAALVGRREAIAVALELLDEAAERMAPWGWLHQTHHVLVAGVTQVTRQLDRTASFFTSSLCDELSQRGVPLVADVGSRPAVVMQAWTVAVGRSRWQELIELNASPRPHLGRRLGWETRFADMPDPFAPLIEIFRLGLAVTRHHSGGMLLFVAVPDALGPGG
jgi:hypothetical protein